jgi:hypothetical protein
MWFVCRRYRPSTSWFVIQIWFSTFFFFTHLDPTSNCTYVNTLITINDLHSSMNFYWRNIFCSQKLNNSTLLEPNIFTSSHFEVYWAGLIVAACPKSRMVEGETSRNEINWFYPDMSTLTGFIEAEAITFQPTLLPYSWLHSNMCWAYFDLVWLNLMSLQGDVWGDTLITVIDSHSFLMLIILQEHLFPNKPHIP